MDGAALSNLIAYAAYFALALLVLRLTCRVSVANRKTFLSILLIAVLFALNTLWEHFLPIANIWLSSILRSLVLLGSGIALAWLLRLSPELNNLVLSLIYKRRRKDVERT